jgi:hypothetical protein
MRVTNMTTTANMHGVGRTIDPSTVPPTVAGPDRDLFDKQEHFMFSVFTSVLLDRSRVLEQTDLSPYSDIGDVANFGKAHAVYQNLVIDKSDAPELDTSELCGPDDPIEK